MVIKINDSKKFTTARKKNYQIQQRILSIKQLQTRKKKNPF